jgi:hypothetical protein
MTEQTPPQDDLSDELRRLADNINQFAKTVWESPERQKIQQDLEIRLNEMGTHLEDAAHQFSQSSTGQQLKNDLEDFNERLTNGEIETKVKKEVINVLDIINQHIEKAANHNPSGPGSGTPQ